MHAFTRALLLAGLLLCQAAVARTLVFSAEYAKTKDGSPDLQKFLDADADTLIIPARTGGWETGPLIIRRGYRLLILQPDCILRARTGAFPSLNDCLLTLEDVQAVDIYGYGSALIMRKQEYREGEWRHAIALRGVNGVTIEGMRIDSSGGDGIYLGGNGAVNFNAHVSVRNCVLSGNRRQGISVISAEDFLLENCRIEGTTGTSPQNGIDFEPNHADERLVRCLVRNCTFTGNRGLAGAVVLAEMTTKSRPVSIDFRDCQFSGSDSGEGLHLSHFPSKAWEGDISFRRCLVRSAVGPLLEVYDKPPHGPLVSFQQCDFDGETGIQSRLAADLPILFLHQKRGGAPFGGFLFRNCIIRSRHRLPLSVQLGILGTADEMEMSLFYSGEIAPLLPEGVSPTRLPREPKWQPPPPMIQDFRSSSTGNCEIGLGNWARDSVFFRTGKTWHSGPWGTKASLGVGESIIAFSRSGGLTSDTLNWRCPVYLYQSKSSTR